jgi:apolipoprotein N-acyltransferase
MRTVLVAVLSGALLWTAFPPMALGWTAFLAPALLLWALRRERRLPVATVAGFAFGVGFFGLLLYWLGYAAPIAVVALVPVLALYPAAFAAALWVARDWSHGAWWAAAVGGWSLMELIRFQYPLGGFAWGSLGYGIGELAWPRGAAQWIGASGLTVLAVAVAAAVAVTAATRGGHRAALAGTLAVAAALTVAGGLWPPTADGAPLRVTVIQGGSPCPGSSCPGENVIIFENHLAATAALPAGEADLVIWPESSAQYSQHPLVDPERAAQLAAQARRLDAHLLVGGARAVDERTFQNLNLLIDPAGDAVDYYAKRQPVPFGEYVPLRPLFDWIPDLRRVPRDMVPGDGPVVFDLPQGRFGSVICFEGAFADYSRETVRAGAGLLVVTTNEASYGDSPASRQFLGMNRMRAVEHGVDLVHASITGSSAVVRADGTIVARTGVLTSAVVSAEVRFRSGPPTLYTRFGDWVQFLAVAGLFGVFVLVEAQQRAPGRREGLNPR